MNLLSKAEIHRVCAESFDSLKPFQRRSASNAFRQMSSGTRRFLVADEVGLGKTYVAKGVIAKRVEQLAEANLPMINIIYICSNQSIAAQNIETLDIFDKANKESQFSTRLTLLASNPLLEVSKHTDKETEQDRASVNFISFTPGTSFQLKRGQGTKEERAILYYLLKSTLKIVTGSDEDTVLTNLLQCNAGKDSWDKSIVRCTGILQQVYDDFEDMNLAKEWLEIFQASQDVTFRFEYLEDVKTKLHMEIKDSDLRRAEDFIAIKNKFIGSCRHKLAKICLNLLQPSLIIMDEFQNFASLMYSAGVDTLDHSEQLMHTLLEKEDGTEDEVPVLLISATPYRFDPMDTDLSQKPAEDFINLIQFLFGKHASENTIPNLRRSFADYRNALMSVFKEKRCDKDLLCHKKAIEDTLHSVMSRTERVKETTDAQSMKQDCLETLSVRSEDVQEYIETFRLFQAFQAGEPLNFCKSSSYLPYFMQNYAYNERIEKRFPLEKYESSKKEGSDEMKTKVRRILDSNNQKIWDLLRQYGTTNPLMKQIEQYQTVPMKNAAIRQLLLEMVVGKKSDEEVCEPWKMLWLPPTFSYWDVTQDGVRKDIFEVFECARNNQYTKRLIFSGWNVVPDAISGLLSYEAERRMVGAHLNAFKSDSLSYSTLKGKLNDGSVLSKALDIEQLAPLYPSTYLANKSIVDVDSTILEIVHARLVDEIRTDLEQLPNNHELAVDTRWYLIALILLDQKYNHTTLLSSEWKLENLRGLSDYDDDSSDSTENDKTSKIELLTAYISHVHNIIQQDFADGINPLGKQPSDLASVLADMALGSPAILALRSLRHESATAKIKMAYDIARAFRAFFNKPSHIMLVRQLTEVSERKYVYWRLVLDYCIAGNLQALLDEMVYINGADKTGVDLMISKIRPNRSAVQIKFPVEVEIDGQMYLEDRTKRVRAGFAQRFGKMKTEKTETVTSTENILYAFNSPFQPFVLCSTSVGQEGLNFHSWCHSVLHWNLPQNPVSLEQRDGRVHRFRGHAIRKNWALQWGDAVMSEWRLGAANDDLWARLTTKAERAMSDHPSNKMGLYPDWLMTSVNPEDSKTTNKIVKINSMVYQYPFSKDAMLFQRLKKQLAGYRLAFGQPNQRELMTYISITAVDEKEMLNKSVQYAIDLTPTT